MFDITTLAATDTSTLELTTNSAGVGIVEVLAP